jgi:thiamine transport system substrate-binding protein
MHINRARARIPRASGLTGAVLAAVTAVALVACGADGSGAAGPSAAGSSPASSTLPAGSTTAADSPSGPGNSSGASSSSGASDGATDAPVLPSSSPAGSAGSVPAAGGTVTLITHDSFAVDKQTLSDFEKSSGITVQILAQGDAGAMVSKLILTKDNPLGDAVFGIDNTFASKALDAGVLTPYTSPLAGEGSDDYSIDPQHRLTAVDYGDVCVNVDHQYFSEHGLAEPTTFDDLAKPEYKDMLVVESPATSSPGLAFLLGTIAHFGAEGWQQYWNSLKDNGVKVDAGWTDAYTVDFSGSSGKGDRPLVVSYASSPPDEVRPGMASAPTGALLDTCFRQIEYAGVLAGAKNPAAAGKVVDFLLSQKFQSQVPEQMYVYPVDHGVTLPAEWAKYAPVAAHPAQLDPVQIAEHRQQWISDWSDLMEG